MRFLADENVRADVIAFLRTAGHDVAVVPKGVANGAVLTLASEERRILLTHDNDFAALWKSPGAAPCTVFHLKVHPPNRERVTGALASALPRLSSLSLGRQLVVIEVDRFHIE